MGERREMGHSRRRAQALRARDSWHDVYPKTFRLRVALLLLLILPSTSIRLTYLATSQDSIGAPKDILVYVLSESDLFEI